MNTPARLRQTVDRLLALRRLGDEDATPATPDTVALICADAEARSARTVIVRFRPQRVPLIVLALLAAVLGLILGSVVPVGMVGVG